MHYDTQTPFCHVVLILEASLPSSTEVWRWTPSPTLARCIRTFKHYTAEVMQTNLDSKMSVHHVGETCPYDGSRGFDKTCRGRVPRKWLTVAALGPGSGELEQPPLA